MDNITVSPPQGVIVDTDSDNEVHNTSGVAISSLLAPHAALAVGYMFEGVSVPSLWLRNVRNAQTVAFIDTNTYVRIRSYK